MAGVRRGRGGERVGLGVGEVMGRAPVAAPRSGVSEVRV